MPALTRPRSSFRPRGGGRDARPHIIEVGTTWAATQHQIVVLAAELDHSGAWAVDGSPTAAHWIAAALDIEVCTAREWVRCGRAIEVLPNIAAAFGAQRLSFSKVRAITRVATPDNEVELIDLAERVPAGRLAHTLAVWLSRNEDPDDRARRHHRDRSFTSRVEPDGMITGTYRLPPLEGGTLLTVLDTTAMRDRSEPRATHGGNGATADASESRTLAQLRADSLVSIVTGGGASGSVMNEVVLHIRGDGCTLDNGVPIPLSVVEAVAPESFIRALIHDAESRPINASGRHRHPTLRQQRVVKERDRACVDCGTEHFLEHDHVPPYEQSRRTLVDELELRCGRCHRRRHADG